MTVIFYGKIIEYTNGVKTYDPGDCSTLRNLIDKLGDDFGEPFKEHLLGDETCIILINAAGVMSTGGLDSPLKKGDKIEILPFVDAG